MWRMTWSYRATRPVTGGKSARVTMPGLAATTAGTASLSAHSSANQADTTSQNNDDQATTAVGKAKAALGMIRSGASWGSTTA